MADHEAKRATRATGRGGDVLLVIDVINDLEFEGGEKVLPWAERVVPRLKGFRGKCDRAGVPVVYINDNFGMWRDNFQEIYAHCAKKGVRGHKVAQGLKPRAEDYFILKPRHSAFYATSLEPLLEDLGAERLILAGIATNLCVLFTAHDAHMRQYPIVVLSDCCAAESDFDHNTALKQLERFCGAVIGLSSEIAPRGKRK